MSAEATKGIVESSLLLLGNSRRRFTGALKRLFVVTPESGSTAPPIPTSSKPIQPPRGLEDFADRMQQIGDGRFAAQRQKEIDIASAKATQIAAEEAEKLRIAQIPIDLARQEASKRYEEERERVAKEASDILESFRIRERLDYIKDTLWGGRGEIRPTTNEFFTVGKKANYTHQNYAYNNGKYIGGFELTHSFPSLKLFDQPEQRGHFSMDGPSYPATPHMQKYEPDVNSTSLSVRLLDLEQDSGEDKRMLRVTSVADIPFREHALSHKIFSVDIPLDVEESETLLTLALTQEAIRRIDSGYSPSQLEEEAREKLVAVRKGPYWQRWGIVK